MKVNRPTLSIGLALVLVAAAWLGAPQAQTSQRVVFALNWFAVGDHAAYWVALERGYYRARGLDVELQNSKGSGDSIAKVDTNRADLGLADAVVVIPRIAQGAKIKVVGAVFDNTPLNIWTRKDTGITRPKDLEGKTLAAPPGDAQRQLFPAFARLNGIDETKVKWVNIEPAAKFVALAEKRADAVPDYTTGQPFWEKAVGAENLVRMPWSQFGFDTYSMAIFASEKSIAERPKVLRDFVAASYQGWRDVMDNPKAALEIFKKRVPRHRACPDRAQHDARTRSHEDRSLREERHRLDRARQDVPHGRADQHVHARHAAQGRLRRGIHDRVPDEDRPAEALIVLDGVGMTYRADSGPVEALRDISFTVDRGEFVALVGPSGCGKSTLLRIIAGLRPASAGQVAVDGRAVAGPIAEVGMVFQAPVLLKWRRIVDNVLLPAELAGRNVGDYRARARQLLSLVGLEDFAEKLPRELSGGMQQRAALCRALLLDPPLLLMDEPFGALDAMTRDELNLELLRVWGERSGRRKTILFVTHSIPEAVFLADRVVVITPRPGRVARVVHVGLPRPRTIATRAGADFGARALEIHDALTRPA